VGLGVNVGPVGVSVGVLVAVGVSVGVGVLVGNVGTMDGVNVALGGLVGPAVEVGPGAFGVQVAIKLAGVGVNDATGTSATTALVGVGPVVSCDCPNVPSERLSNSSGLRRTAASTTTTRNATIMKMTVNTFNRFIPPR
jgi:hypothetical protein